MNMIATTTLRTVIFLEMCQLQGFEALLQEQKLCAFAVPRSPKILVPAFVIETAGQSVPEQKSMDSGCVDRWSPSTQVDLRQKHALYCPMSPTVVVPTS